MKLSSESHAASNARIAPNTMVAAASNAVAPSTTRRLIVGSILPWRMAPRQGRDRPLLWPVDVRLMEAFRGDRLGYEASILVLRRISTRIGARAQVALRIADRRVGQGERPLRSLVTKREAGRRAAPPCSERRSLSRLSFLRRTTSRQDRLGRIRTRPRGGRRGPSGWMLCRRTEGGQAKRARK